MLIKAENYLCLINISNTNSFHVKITSGGEGDGGGEVLTDDDKSGDCETSKCTDAGYV